MRNYDDLDGRYGQRSRGGPSLDELADMLDRIERRMDMVPQRSDHGWQNEIRSRQHELAGGGPRDGFSGRQQSSFMTSNRGQRDRSDALRAELDSLRNELSAERGRSTSGSHDYPATHAPSAAQGGDGSMASLRHDIDALKREVMMVAKEETVRDLANRWSAMEREFAGLPERLGSRDDLLAVAQRIDSMTDELRSLPQALSLTGMQQQLQGLSRAVEMLADRPSTGGDAAAADMHERLDEISRAIASLQSRPAAGGGEAIERLEMRLQSLVHAVERGSTPDLTPLEERMSALGERIEALQGATMQSGHGQGFEDINIRLEEIAGQISDIGTRPSESSGVSDAQLLADMAARLDDVANRVSASEEAGRTTATQLTALLDERMQELAGAFHGLASRAPAEAAAIPDNSETLARLENQIGEIGELLASRDPISSSAAPDGALNRIEAQMADIVAMLASSRNDPADGSDAENFERIEARLSDLAHVVAGLSASPSGDGRSDPAFMMPDPALGRIEQQLAGLSDLLAQERQTATRDAGDADVQRIEGQLSDLAHMVSNLAANITSGDGAAHGASAMTDPALGRIEQQLAGLSDLLARGLAETSSAPQDADLARIEGQLADLAAYVANLPTMDGSGAIASEQLDRVEQRLAQLASVVEAQGNGLSAAGGHADHLARLEDQMARISGMLAEIGTASNDEGADLGALEAQIAHLSRELSGMGSARSSMDPEVIQRLDSLEESLARGQDNAIAMARQVVEEAVAGIGMKSGDADSETVRALADQLAQLDELSRQSSARNDQTFEAIHDTLLKVVDHLSGLEERISIAPADPQPVAKSKPDVPQQVMAYAPMQNVDAPSIAMDDDILPMHDAGHQSRAQTMSPSDAAAAAALAALNNDSAITGAEVSRAATTPSRKAQAEPDYDDGDDVMIEPGEGGPDLASIIQRVRAEGGEPRERIDAAASSRSDFVAAARRAAQAAVADSNIATETPKDARKGSGFAGIKDKLLSRRKALLMGTGAILLALVAIPSIASFFGSGDDQFVADSAIVMERPFDEQSVIIAPDETKVAAINEDIDEPVVDLSLAQDGDTAVDLPMEEQDNFQTELDGDDASMEADAGFTTLSVPEGIGSVALRDAVQTGDPRAMFVEAQAIAARGQGAPEALASAGEWYQAAAELGFAPAQYRYANFLEKGTGGLQDYVQAKVFYQLAADQGNASAMHNLGSLSANAAAGTPDLETASQWFHKAAELGIRDSQFNLGILYGQPDNPDMPDAIAQDLVEAYKWFALAAAQNDALAAQKRDELAAIMTDEQVELAKGAVILWKQREINAETNIVDMPDAWKVSGDSVAAIGEQQPDTGEMKRAITNIQAILNNAGYDAGPVDGVMGAKTRDAIMAFQKDNGMAPNGAVDRALVEKLLEVNRKAAEGNT